MDERRQAPWAERVLVERLSGGDETALVELYDRYAPFVYGLAVRTLVDRQIAEEVTQEVFVSLWEHPKQIDPGRGTLARLSRDAHPSPCRRRRAQRGGAPAPGGPGAHGTRTHVPDVADVVLRSDTTGRVRTAVEVLPDAQRQALELAYFDGYTYRQVAEVLGIPEGTAKSRLRLALTRIAENLGSEMSEQGGRWA